MDVEKGKGKTKAKRRRKKRVLDLQAVMEAASPLLEEGRAAAMALRAAVMFVICSCLSETEDRAWSHVSRYSLGTLGSSRTAGR